MRHQQATLTQIAQKLDVSITTVSRILASKKLNTFSSKTIELVRAAAAEFHYRPNRLVRGIQTGYTGLIGVLMPASNDYYGKIFEGIHDALVKRDRAPIVLWTSHDSTGGIGKSELEQIHTLVDLRVDGIILKPIFDAASDAYLHEIFQRNIPLVVVDRELPKVRSNFVGTDDNAGVQSAIEHLVDLGHTSIGYFGPETPVSTGLNRQQAFNACVSNYPGITGSNYLTNSWEPEIDVAASLFNSTNRPTAVVTVNDNFAYMLYQTAAQQNLRIPDDLSVVGFGNIFIYSHLKPALTTLEQHPYHIGLSAVELLVSCLNSNSSANRLQKILIPPDLLVRESTSVPRRKSIDGLSPKN